MANRGWILNHLRLLSGLVINQGLIELVSFNGAGHFWGVQPWSTNQWTEHDLVIFGIIEHHKDVFESGQP